MAHRCGGDLLICLLSATDCFDARSRQSAVLLCCRQLERNGVHALLSGAPRRSHLNPNCCLLRVHLSPP